MCSLHCALCVDSYATQHYSILQKASDFPRVWQVPSNTLLHRSLQRLNPWDEPTKGEWKRIPSGSFIAYILGSLRRYVFINKQCVRVYICGGSFSLSEGQAKVNRSLLNVCIVTNWSVCSHFHNTQVCRDGFCCQMSSPVSSLREKSVIQHEGLCYSTASFSPFSCVNLSKDAPLPINFFFMYFSHFRSLFVYSQCNTTAVFFFCPVEESK